jgi:spore maturation protein CgeB
VIRNVAIAPLFGRAMYRLFSQSKIIINTAIDVAGQDRGNIRCFEALGCGALMLSDSGRYPSGMVDGQTIVTYDHIDQIPALIDQILSDEPRRLTIASAGLALMKDRYSKTNLWQQFQDHAARLS